MVCWPSAPSVRVVGSGRLNTWSCWGKEEWSALVVEEAYEKSFALGASAYSSASCCSAGVSSESQNREVTELTVNTTRRICTKSLSCSRVSSTSPPTTLSLNSITAPRCTHLPPTYSSDILTDDHPLVASCPLPQPNLKRNRMDNLDKHAKSLSGVWVLTLDDGGALEIDERRRLPGGMGECLALEL